MKLKRCNIEIAFSYVLKNWIKHGKQKLTALQLYKLLHEVKYHNVKISSQDVIIQKRLLRYQYPTHTVSYSKCFYTSPYTLVLVALSRLTLPVTIKTLKVKGKIVKIAQPLSTPLSGLREAYTLLMEQLMAGKVRQSYTQRPNKLANLLVDVLSLNKKSTLGRRKLELYNSTSVAKSRITATYDKSHS